MAGPNRSLELVCPMGVQTFPPRNLFARRILGFVFLPEAEFVNWISWRGVPNEVPVVAHERWHQAFRDAIQGDASSAGLVVEVSVRVRTGSQLDSGLRSLCQVQKLSYSCCLCAISGMTKCNERAHCVTLAQALCFLQRAVPQRVPSMVERSQGAFYFWCSSFILCGSSRSKSSGASESARLCRCIWCDLPGNHKCFLLVNAFCLGLLRGRHARRRLPRTTTTWST